MKLKTFFLLITTGISVLCMNAETHAFVINHVFIDPVSNTQSVGSTFSVILKGENFDLGMDGGAIDIAFDPSILQVNTVSIDASFWDISAFSGNIDNTLGLIDFIDVAQFSSNTIGTIFDIATISFTAIGTGLSYVTPSLNSLDPISVGGNVIAINLQGGEVSVPEPTSIALLATGLLGLGSSRRKKKNQK